MPWKYVYVFCSHYLIRKSSRPLRITDQLMGYFNFQHLKIDNYNLLVKLTWYFKYLYSIFLTGEHSFKKHRCFLFTCYNIRDIFVGQNDYLLKMILCHVWAIFIQPHNEFALFLNLEGLWFKTCFFGSSGEAVGALKFSQGLFGRREKGMKSREISIRLYDYSLLHFLSLNYVMFLVSCIWPPTLPVSMQMHIVF